MSITDGRFVCSLCGEWYTGCLLCGTAPLSDRRSEIAREAEARRKAELEEAEIERAMRRQV